MTAVKTLLDGLRPGKKKKTADEDPDQALDEALQRLSEATAANTEVCEKVRKRQDSAASLKLSVVPSSPPPSDSAPE